MKLEDYTKNITIFVEPLDESGCYMAHIRGFTIDQEMIEFDIELSGCYTMQVLQDTLSAELEEILSCRYHYSIDTTIDEEDLLHDGGIFNESD